MHPPRPEITLQSPPWIGLGMRWRFPIPVFRNELVSSYTSVYECDGTFLYQMHHVSRLSRRCLSLNDLGLCEYIGRSMLTIIQVVQFVLNLPKKGLWFITDEAIKQMVRVSWNSLNNLSFYNSHLF